MLSKRFVLAAVTAAALAVPTAATSAPAPSDGATPRASAWKLAAATSYGQVGDQVTVTLAAPAKAKRFVVESKIHGKWLHNAQSVGKVTSVARSGARQKVTASAVLAFGKRSFRITAKVKGKRVASAPVTLSGFQWIPLTDAIDGWHDGNVIVSGVSMPFLSEQKAYSTSDEELTSDGVVCRRVDVGISIDTDIIGGSAKFQFATDAGLVKEFVVQTAARQGRATIDLDGSPMTVYLSHSVDDHQHFDDAVEFAGSGWCDGTNT